MNSKKRAELRSEIERSKKNIQQLDKQFEILNQNLQKCDDEVDMIVTSLCSTDQSPHVFFAAVKSSEMMVQSSGRAMRMAR